MPRIQYTTAVSPDLGNSAINPYALSGLDSGLWAISLREVKVLVKTLLDRGGGDYPPVMGVTRHRVLHRARGLSFTTLATTGPDVAPTFRFGITPTRYPRLPVTAAGDPAVIRYQRRLVVVLHIIWMIVLGLVVGLIARAVVPGRQPMGFIATAVLGIVGAYVGGTLGSVVFPPHQFDIHPPIKHAFLGALVGAVLLLWIFKLVTSRTRTL